MAPPGDLWRPAAGWPALRRRAEIAARVREFFSRRGVLEVETPQLAAATVTDPHLHSLAARFRGPGAPPEGRRLYLQTSPEYAMKRLLAAGSGPIWQLARVFRDGEAGARHNPEFALLEWYRPGLDHLELADEVGELLEAVLGTPPPERTSYRDAFLRHAGVDPFSAPLSELAAAAGRALGGEPPELPADETGLDEAAAADARDAWLDLLVAVAVEPHLGRGRPTVLHDYPASQAALARLRRPAGGGPAVAARFEVYLEGVELANGFHELADPDEQRRRFEADLARRRRLGLPAVPVDERLLAALEAGLPDCAGVALGFDRLVMLAVGAERIEEVLAFPVDRA